MTVWKLQNKYYEYHPTGHYFDPDTLKFFGETLSSMRVLKETCKIKEYSGELHECYILSKLSRNYPGGARRTYAYFDVETFDDIIPVRILPHLT